MKPSSPSPQTTILTVPAALGGKRLDVYLAGQLPSFSRSQIQGLIKSGNIAAQFPVKVLKASMIVLEGQSFQVTVPPAQKSDIAAQSISLDILFEDEDLLVVNKPVG